MENKHYNYLLNKNLEEIIDFDINSRIDPDSSSCKLYEDEKEVFFSNITEVENIKQKFPDKPPFYTIKLGGKYLWSSDYIGPSVHWAKKRGISDEEIKKFLKICRILGGHTLWPRGGNRQKGIGTINQARGGDKGVYDRIDWTLQLIKYCYESNNENEYFDKLQQLLSEEYFYKYRNNFKRIYDSFSSYKEEFYFIGTFEDYCNRFKMVGSFVNKSYEIIWIADNVPLLPSNYSEYISKLCKMIETRNDIIHSY